MRSTVVTLILVLAAGAQGAAFTPPPPIDPSQRPALLYSESEYGKEGVSLYLAYREGAEWKRDPVASAAFLAVEQLKDAKFLVAAGPSAAESELYLTDLSTGTSTQVTTRKGHSPIAFPRPHERFYHWEQANKVFLLQDATGAGDVEFITVDYAAMTTESKLLSKSLFGGKFSEDLRTRIAPNGAHIAYLEAIATTSTAPRVSDFTLKIYHFSDGSVTVAAPRITVQVSADAPAPFGWPPIEWFDWEAVIYGNTTAVAAGSEADITFSTANVHRDEVVDLLVQRLPLTPGGGELFRKDPLTREIFYRPGAVSGEEYVIDTTAQVLMTYRDPTRLQLSQLGDKTEVRDGNRLLFSLPHFGRRLDSVTSPKLRHHAYALTTPAEAADKERKAEIFVNVGESEAEKAAGPGYYLRPLAWLE